MKVRIQTQGFDLTPAIGARVHDRMRQTMSRYADDIIGVDVFLKDLNGPKGGRDKEATVRVELRYLAPITVSTTHVDMYKAIDISAKRIRRTVRRSMQRKDRVRRRGLQYVTATAGEF